MSVISNRNENEHQRRRKSFSSILNSRIKQFAIQIELPVSLWFTFSVATLWLLSRNSNRFFHEFIAALPNQSLTIDFKVICTRGLFFWLADKVFFFCLSRQRLRSYNVAQSYGSTKIRFFTFSTHWWYLYYIHFRFSPSRNESSPNSLRKHAKWFEKRSDRVVRAVRLIILFTLHS